MIKYEQILEKIKGKMFIVARKWNNEDWKIGNYKMKIGDILRVVDWGMGMVDYIVVFENLRLQKRFQTAFWYFRACTEPLNWIESWEKIKNMG